MTALTNQFCVIEPSTSKVLEKFNTLISAVEYAKKVYISTGFSRKVVCQLDIDADGDGSCSWNVVKQVTSEVTSV